MEIILGDFLDSWEMVVWGVCVYYVVEGVCTYCVCECVCLLVCREIRPDQVGEGRTRVESVGKRQL